ncbi:MAG TPA: hypothetical protein ENN17_03080 [bacterium]|nr:hypothetical protein [bacterium]
MKSNLKYQTAQSMRVALEERLNRMAGDKGMDVMRLRRHVAFDRFLIRLFSADSKNLIVKGGYAIELWIKNARTTKDIDITFSRAHWEEFGPAIVLLIPKRSRTFSSAFRLLIQRTSSSSLSAMLFLTLRTLPTADTDSQLKHEWQGEYS